MNRGTIPIIARLHSLQTAAHFAVDGSRVIADAYHPSPLTALLREVNETILGRALRFDASGGRSLTLEASGRRVLRVIGASGLPGAESCLAAEVLEDEQKDDLIKLMQALATPRQELRVTISARGVAGEGVSVGLPVALLADLMLVDLNDPTPPGSADAGIPQVDEPLADAAHAGTTAPAARDIARFVRALGPTVMAWVIKGGDADGSTDGPEEMVTHLQDFLDEEVDSLHRQLDLVSGHPGRPACMVLGSAMIEGHGVLCARTDGAMLLGLFVGSPAQSLIHAWAEARV